VLGTVDEPSDAANYDPAPLVSGDPGAKEPSGLTWNPATRIKIKSAASDRIEIALSHENDLSSLVTFEINGDGSFRGSFVPDQAATNVAYLRVGPRVTSDEAFYGLGEYFDSVNHRGKVRAMQIELSNQLESNYNEAHVPVPFVTSSKAWGFFVENPYPAAFDVGKTDPERIAATFGTGLASKEGLSFHIFGAEHPLDVTKRYYEVSGYPALPARWALGPLVWRDENDDQAQFENDLDTIRSLDLATSAVWIDRPYATGVNTFDFDATKFPNPQAMIDKAHALGFRMALWHTPYEDENDPSTQALRDEANANGYYPPQPGLLLNK
jgi:alpha-D-xyloside xylohydrolase